MSLRILGRLAGVVAITMSLAGCIDVAMDIDVQSETTAKATTTSTMGKDFYSMAKAGAAGSEKTEGGFCTEPNSTLTENPDGGASCVEVSEGKFADLKLGENDKGATFTVVSPGVVRVAFSTKDMQGDLASSAGGEGAEADEQTKAMMLSFFEGHTLTLRIKGKEVTDTNMKLSADKTSAELVIPFPDLINGTATLPEEVYAVVRVN